MGKGSSNKTTTEPPAWVKPLVEGAGHDILNTVHGNAGNLQGLSNSLNGMLPGLQSMAMDQSTLQPGIKYNQDVLNGKYLGQGNPYLQGMIDQTGQDVGNKVNSTFSAAGRTGGGANQQILGGELAKAENTLRYNDYANERNAMGQASSALPAYQAAKFSGVSPLLGAYQTAGQLPYYGINAESGIGSLFGGYGQQTQKQGGNLGGDIFSAAMTALPFILSDRRLKKNIEKVGEASDGLGIYEYEYKFDPDNNRLRGVMADEVEKLRPWAHVANFRGEYAGVNYAALGSLA